MRTRLLIRRLVVFSLAHYAILILLSGLIFLTSHLPPKIINLDPFTNVLVFLEDILVLPRRVLFQMWPGETTPHWMGWALTIANSLVWGTMLAGLTLLRTSPAFRK